ncbi:MAG: hypothetical protein SV760_03445, partial [Halobacteria archaeon]|nr:hypothetical protein [Halobacteria archaeon]
MNLKKFLLILAVIFVMLGGFVLLNFTLFGDDVKPHTQQGIQVSNVEVTELNTTSKYNVSVKILVIGLRESTNAHINLTMYGTGMSILQTDRI